MVLFEFRRFAPLLMFCCLVAGVGLSSTLCAEDTVTHEDEASTPAEGVVEESKKEHAEESDKYQNPPLAVEFPLFIFTLVLFVGFLFVMKNSAWGPMIAGLNARESRVQQAELDAQNALAEAESLKGETESRLAEVQEQVKAIVAEARTKAEAEKAEIVSKAQAEAERVKSEALAAIATAREEAVEELSRSVDEQVAMATEHVIGRRL